MFPKLKRILNTTFKDLARNRSTTLSSSAVMTLVFLVFTCFGFFAFAAIKFMNYVETREHLEVFFNTDVDENTILEVKQELESTGKTAYITYTTQEEAAEFLRQRHSENPLILGAITPEALPASLAIRAKKIEYVTELNSMLESIDKDQDLIYKIGYNEDTTNLLKDLLTWVKIIGGILFTFLVIVIFLVSLITVEMGIISRKDELSIMQLVGGGKWYIRAPFIVQGMFYGIAGAFFSSLIIFSLGTVFYLVKDQSATLGFISNFFSDLDWPELTPQLVIIWFVVEILAGAIIGSINSLIAVFRRL
ncbi:MAG: permease-like cell division protein FtsX [Candidatus Dojkabacteria bacterium]|nr:permease-like cell division protein FtsX [Candidatus Dojkabacteria bacterium]